MIILRHMKIAILIITAHHNACLCKHSVNIVFKGIFCSQMCMYSYWYLYTVQRLQMLLRKTDLESVSCIYHLNFKISVIILKHKIYLVITWGKFRQCLPSHCGTSFPKWQAYLSQGEMIYLLWFHPVKMPYTRWSDNFPQS